MGSGRTYYDDKVACRAGGCNWDAGGRVRERVRRLYVARISNKLSADPLARSFIMTSTRLHGRAWTRPVINACVRPCVRGCVRGAADIAFHTLSRRVRARVRANVDASCKNRCH